MSEREEPPPSLLTLADIATLFDKCPSDARMKPVWPHSPFAYWLASSRPTWCVAGRGPAYDEVRALILEAGRSYELSNEAPGAADLLILDGPWEGDAVDPTRWQALLAAGAIVLVHGLHPGHQGARLWQVWRRERPSAPFFTLPGSSGLGLLLIGEGEAPTVLRTLCALPRGEAAAFEQACAAASVRWGAVQRERDILLRNAHLKRQVSSLQRVAERNAGAFRATLAEHEASTTWRVAKVMRRIARNAHLKRPVFSLQRVAERYAVAFRATLVEHAAVEASTTWRVAKVMRRIAYRLPAPVRTRARRIAQLVWWTLRGRLREYWRVSHPDLQQVVPGKPAPVAPVGFTMAGREATRRQLSGLDLPASTLLMVGVGYVAADTPVETLRRAIGSANAALDALGQGDDKRVMVADDGFAAPLPAVLPRGVACLPRTGEPGPAAAHNRMMRQAFAEGADVYVAVDPAGLFDPDALVALMRMLRAHGRRALVEGAVQPPMRKPVGEHDLVAAWASPFCLAISRLVYDAVGAFDEQMDLAASAVDLSLRSKAVGIPTLHAVDAHYWMVASTGAPRPFRPTPDAAASAWILASKWRQDSVADRLALLRKPLRQPLPPVPVSCDNALLATGVIGEWWSAREEACASQLNREPGDGGPRKCEDAVLPPEELDVCLRVPFSYSFEPVPSQPFRIAAMVHLFYEDLAAEMAGYLRNVPAPLDVLITTDTDEKRLFIENVFAGWTPGSVEVHVVPNRGDIAPKLDCLHQAHSRYDLVLYLHGKKSPHWQHGREWREYLYRTLVGSPDIVRSVLAAFASSPALGIVLPQHWDLVRPALNWGYSFDDAQELAARMDIELVREQPLEFPSGSMFWARSAALRPLLDLGLTADDFPEGVGGGVTLAHAIERLFLRICERSGHTWIKIGDRSLLHGLSGLHEVHGPVDLGRLLRELPFLLSDPALRVAASAPDGTGQGPPFRFRPVDDPHPRWTLLSSQPSDVSSDGATGDGSVDLFQRMGSDQMPPVELRTVDIQPRPSVGVPSALDVRRNDIFFVADERGVAVALQLVASQRAFFGTAHQLVRLSSLSESAFELPSDLLQPAWPPSDDAPTSPDGVEFKA
jgi:hypothetical protein